MRPLSVAGAAMCLLTTFGAAAYKLCEARLEEKRVSKVSNAKGKEKNKNWDNEENDGGKTEREE